MRTKNSKINITFEDQIASMLSTMAKKQKKSVASIAKELILEALERHEDMALSKLAESRDIENIKTISHKDAWK